MSKSLEKFIRDNRDAFEQDGPSAGLWERIADQLPAPAASADSASAPSTSPFRAVHRSAPASRFRWAWAAAVALLVLSVGGWWLARSGTSVSQPEVATFSPVYAKEMAQYASLIDTKRTELRHLTQSNPDLYGQFSQDLDRLESSYRGLKKDLPSTPNQDVLIQAMIQNLQLQIDLLNEQLRVIQRIKQQTTTNEPV